MAISASPLVAEARIQHADSRRLGRRTTLPWCEASARVTILAASRWGAGFAGRCATSSRGRRAWHKKREFLLGAAAPRGRGVNSCAARLVDLALELAQHHGPETPRIMS